MLHEAAGQLKRKRLSLRWDNAPVESFLASLKREMVHRYQCATRQEARQALFSWIEVCYNRKRRHSALGYLSPQEFEQRQNAGQGVLPMAA